MVVGVFEIAPRLPDRHDLMWQSVKILNVFNTLTLKQTFWKINTFFKKLEYSFFVESTKIENASFPCKTEISEANVKANKMVLQNGPITKNGVLPATTFWWCFSPVSILKNGTNLKDNFSKI